MSLTELVTSEEERCFLRGKKMHLEFYALEHWLFNLNFKKDETSGISN